MAEEDEHRWRDAVFQHLREHGGHAMRARAANIAALRTSDDELATYELVEWGFGQIAATVAQRMASRAWNDGARGELLGRLRALGSKGVHAQNCSRDLCHLVEEVLGEMLVEPALFDLPMMVTKGDEVGPMTVEHAIVDPHVWFANHYEHV